MKLLDSDDALAMLPMPRLLSTDVLHEPSGFFCDASLNSLPTGTTNPAPDKIFSVDSKKLRLSSLMKFSRPVCKSQPWASSFRLRSKISDKAGFANKKLMRLRPTCVHPCDRKPWTS